MLSSTGFSHGVQGRDGRLLRVLRGAFAHPPRAASHWRRKLRGHKVLSAVLGSVLVHAMIGVYLWQAKFEPQYRTYADEVTDVELIRPSRPPPPPPPPPPPNTPPPPPKLQARPPAAVVDLPPTIAPLPVPPVVQRIELPQAPRIPEPSPPAPAPPPEPPRPTVIQSPDWLRKPSGEDVVRYYPERALRMNVEGRATLSCTVTTNGSLEGCTLVSETPDNQEFGGAALRMTRLFKLRPMTRDGVPVSGGTVKIPIRFQLPKE